MQIEYITHHNMIKNNRAHFPIPPVVWNYFVPFSIFFLMFVASRYILPHRMFKLSQLYRLSLLGYLFVNWFLYDQKKIPSLGFILVMILSGMVSDLWWGNIPPVFYPKPWIGYLVKSVLLKGNIGLIIILAIYLNSWSRLIRCLKMLVIMITCTISIIGLYQLYTGHLIADFSSIAEWGIITYFETDRLGGLIYGCSNEAAGLILLSLGLLIGTFFVRINILLVSLICVNVVALVMTYVRAGLIAFGVMIFIGYLIDFKVKQKTIKPMVGVTLITTFLLFVFYKFGIEHLYATNDIVRFLSPSSFYDKVDLLRGVLQGVGSHFFWGGGTGDLSLICWRVTGIFRTPHNFFLDWILRFGFIASVLLSVLVVRQILRVIKYLFLSETIDAYRIGIGLFLSYLGVLINSCGTGDDHYFIPLMYVLCNAYLKYAPVKSMEVKNSG